jgi:hypothetical protein
MSPIRKDLLVSTTKGNVIPQYLASGDPALKDYYPEWVKHIADDATVEGSMLNGALQGADAVPIDRTHYPLTVRGPGVQVRRSLRRQRFIEHYIAKVNGEPIGCVVLIARNAAGQTQHVVASYRPFNSVVVFARLLREKFAGTPIAEHFGDSESSR